MANNCLVTKLKASTNNDALCTMDELKLEVKKTSDTLINNQKEFQCILYYGNTGTFRVSGNGALGTNASTVDSSTTKEIDSTSAKVYLKNEDCKVFISNKYKIEKLYITPTANSIIQVDVNEFKYLTTGTLKDLKINMCAKGDACALSNITSLTQLHLQKSNCYGVLAEAFGKLKNLTVLYIEESSSITGSIEDLASALVDSGKTSGSLNVHGNGVITYNGEAIVNGVSKVITFNSSLPNGYSIA